MTPDAVRKKERTSRGDEPLRVVTEEAWNPHYIFYAPSCLAHPSSALSQCSEALSSGWMNLFRVLPVPDSSLPAATLLKLTHFGSWSLHELAAWRLPRQQTSATDFCSPRNQEGSGHVLTSGMGHLIVRWQKSVAPKFALRKW